GPETMIARIGRTKRMAQVHDLAATRGYIERDPLVVLAVETGGVRTFLGVPMLKEDELVGAVLIYRQEVRPFTEKQITLLTSFASQAVIAIENARLLNELRQRTDDLGEALEQQTATSEVLSVISTTTGNLQPVFDKLLANATRLCGAKFGMLNLYDGDSFRTVAFHNAPPAYVEARSGRSFRPHPDSGLGYVERTIQIAHIEDVRARQVYLEGDPVVVALADLAGARTLLIVPMLRENELVGTIGIYRQEVRPFADKQIELVKNFAAQAVIAIENTRLLNELRESLQQQTATSEVLQVISSSPGELQPVFDAMLERATRVCEANFGILFRFEHGTARPIAMIGVPQAYVDFAQREGTKVSEHAPVMRVAKTKQFVHVVDFTTEYAYVVERNPMGIAGAEIAGTRTLVVAPMLQDDDLVGAIAIYRQEVRPFTDKQIELLNNFAKQAVIAIENTRLLNELRESLQQQTATADVLKVISRSTFDLQTVFDALVEAAVRVCD